MVPGAAHATPHPGPDAVVEVLANDIVSGRLPAGGRLPTEREAALRFGTSRASVSKAYARLEDWRLVTVRHGSGVEVRPRREWSLRAMPLLLAHADRQLRHDLAGELADLLAAFVGDAFRRCQRTMRPGDLDDARAAVEGAWRVRHDSDAWLVADTEQFALTLEACGLWATLFVVNDTGETYRSLLAAAGRAHPPDDYVAAHEAQFTALEANRFDDAADLLCDYLARSTPTEAADATASTHPPTPEPGADQ
ncbi:MAG: FadR family transcriptional regulator [Acidimicrobiia bacterium]|nr:FadR family transcriptional regulator [Acidimicrobiia bacterium]